MILSILLFIAVLLGAMTYFLWRTGSVGKAEEPDPVIDRPIMDPKERRAIMKRLRRWKAEGRLTPSEFETIYGLCQTEWDAKTAENDDEWTA